MINQNPNILILCTDMQRADTLHALGNPVIKIPHLDRLMAEGTAYTNCFSPSPVCGLAPLLHALWALSAEDGARQGVPRPIQHCVFV